LLDATGALLAEKSFDDVSINEIVQRAGTSVGAFYGRFSDKESVLDCFDERFFQFAQASSDEFFASNEWREASLAESVAQLVSLLVCNHRRHSGILRALALRMREHPESRFRERAARHNRHVLERIKDHLLSRSQSIKHSNPARAVELAFLFAVSSVREVLLFSGVAGLSAPDDELAAELTRSFLAYLGIGRLRASQPHSPRSTVARGRRKAQSQPRKRSPELPTRGT
jgi:AcrR family transcriptional regulator